MALDQSSGSQRPEPALPGAPTLEAEPDAEAGSGAPLWTAPSEPVSAQPGLRLTRREAEVLRLLADGLSNAAIAQRLARSPRTVSTHLTAIYEKLGVPSRSAAVRVALDHGLR